MRKIFFTWVCLAVFAGTSMAQYSNNAHAGNRVGNMRTNAPDLYRSYRVGKVLKNTGMGLTLLGGISAIVVGISTNTDETILVSAGTACILVGTPIWIVGGGKKRRARRAYLRDYGSEVPAQPSPYLKLNGTGLALVF